MTRIEEQNAIRTAARNEFLPALRPLSPKPSAFPELLFTT